MHQFSLPINVAKHSPHLTFNFKRSLHKFCISYTIAIWK
ncbi:unnamed protein product [Ixodes pacificus]